MSTMISESGSESSTTMSSAPLTNSRNKLHHMDDAIKRKKKKKKRPAAKIDDLADADGQHVEQTKKCKETRRDSGEIAHLSAKKKKLSIKSEIVDNKSHHSKTERIIGERSDDRGKPGIKSESRDKKSRSKLHNGLGQKDKSPRSGLLRTKEKKRYEEIEIDGITINAFRTWEDLQDELNDRISASMRRNATISATNSSNNQSPDSEVSRAHTSNDSFIGINGSLSSHDSHEPSSSGLIRPPTSSDTQELAKNLNASYQNERILNDRCNTTINESIGHANTSKNVNHPEPRLNDLPHQTQHNNHNISHRHQEHNNDNQHNQNRNHHRHQHQHHDSKNSRSHTSDISRTDERVRQQQQQQDHHHAAPLGPPAFERAIIDFKRQQQQQHQNDFFGRPPSPPQPSSRAPPPVPPPAPHTAHQYFQQYHQLYQHMQNSTQHPLSHQQSALPQGPPPPLPFPQSNHPPLHHQQNPYMQSLIEHHHHQQQQQQHQQQHQHLQHHMPLVPPSLPTPYMSPFTITDTIHTISRQTIIPPPMMPPPPALPSMPGLEQLSVTSRYGMGPGPGRMSALEHSHLTSHHQPPSYAPSPTERSFMEFARSYANASNLSSNYSSLINQSPLTKGPPPGASLYGQLDRISQKSELHHAFGAAGLGPYPGSYPSVGSRPPSSAWQLPGW